MQKKKATITGAILASILGGSIYLGAEVGRPDCDYVVIKDETKEEICISEEQANIIVEKLKNFKVGVGNMKIGGEVDFNLFEKK